MILYSYWRSTTSYRVRIALNLKQLEFTIEPVNLLNGEQTDAGYLSLNPSGGVPALKLDSGEVLTQSMAIIAYLDTIAPTPSLLPGEPLSAARISSAANIVACDIHPINNLKILSRLKSMDISDQQRTDWMNHWMHEGFTAFNALIDKQGDFSFGNSVTLADVCLIPQLYNAHRWGLDMTPFSRLLQIEKHCLAMSAFDDARPENQPDAS